MAEEKKSGFSKIESRGEALRQLKNCSIGFLIISIWTGVVSVISNPVGLLDAVLILVTTFFMFMHHSRVAVLLLLAFCIYNFAARFAPLLGFGQKSDFGGLLVPVIVLIMAIRACEAVFVLNKQLANVTSSNLAEGDK